MHYPHKTSNIKRARKIGFRARMKTKKGRQTINRKRRAGRRVQVV
jgi:ribosomal protein L34